MSSTCHYRGNVVDGLVELAEAGHLWGPDLCGSRRLSWDDLCASFRVGGSAQAVATYAAEIIPRGGAMYELHDCEYDEATDTTTATFTPKVNPLQATRYYGGQASAQPEQVIAGTSRLSRADQMRAR